MKFVLLSPKNRTVWNFRGDLVKEFIKKGYEVVVTGPDQTGVEKIEELGARFIEIPMNKNGTSIIGDVKYCRELIRLLRKEKPDITLGYTVKPVIYGAIAAKIAAVLLYSSSFLRVKPKEFSFAMTSSRLTSPPASRRCITSSCVCSTIMASRWAAASIFARRINTRARTR